LLGCFLGLLGVVLIIKALTVYTDFLWFGEVGQGAVIRTMWVARLQLAFAVGLVFFVWLLINLRIARREVPKEVVIGPRLLPDAERRAIELHFDKSILVFALLGAVLAGLAASSQWQEWLKFVNGVPFNKEDPLLHKDIGFYIFRLPFWQYLWRTAFYAVVVAFVASTLVHLYNESIRIQGSRVLATTPARIHCLTLLALAFLLKGVGYRLGVYTLLFTPSGAVPGGPGYSAVHYRLPVLYVQMAACVVAAGIALATIKARNLRLPAYALAGLIIVALLFGFSFPSVMENARVKPNALKLEPTYIAHNIEATCAAYGLDKVTARQHRIATELTSEAVAQNPVTIRNIRIWDDRPLQYTYRQQQALRQYYEFPRVDLDRYVVGGQLRQISIATRQIDYDQVGNQWPNRHLQYTHGYGLCLSPVNLVDSEGWPHYWIKDFPPRRLGEAAADENLAITQPGLYFMENVAMDLYGYGKLPPPQGNPPAGPGGGGMPGAPPGAPQPGSDQPAPSPERKQARRNVSPLEDRQRKDDYVIVRSGIEEIDYPAGSDVGATMKTTYQGQAGVPVKGWFRRLAFFARWFPDWPILFYNLGSDSRIIYNRLVPDRIRVIAPFLFPDVDAYPVIHDGRVVWIIDAYTFAARYPYATSIGSNGPGLMPNYVRNSVKCTVDAYDGTTKLYVWDETDPLIQTYRKIFPTLFSRKEEMPENLRRHTRYPRFFFDLQSGIFARYHVKNPVTFFQGADAWSIPVETLADDERPVEPYYVLMTLPSDPERKAEFLLIRPYTPVTREKLNMVAWICARCDPEHYGELLLYRFPNDQLSYGPMQIEARISQNESLANFFNWKSKANDIIRGHTLVIPIGDSLMYVEPIYLQSRLNPVPKLSLVVVLSQDHIGYGPNLADALNMLFGGAGAANPPSSPAEAGAPAQPSGGTQTEAQLIGQLSRAYADAESRRMAGDFAGYASKVKELGPLIDQLKQLQKKGP
jgi:hypothetical protein